MATKKRGNQDGTFYQRPNGSWCGQVMINNHRYTVYGSGIQECRQKLRDKINEKKVTSTNQSFYSYCVSFFNQQLTDGAIKETTFQQKVYSLNPIKHLCAGISISDVTVSDIQRIANYLKSKGLKPSSIKTQIASLLTCCAEAHRRGLLQSPIVLKQIHIGQIQKVEAPMETLEFARAGIATIKNKQIQMALNIILHSGLRAGEVLALKWSDINIDNCQITVNRTIAMIRGKGRVEQSPKSNRVGEIVQLPSSFKQTLIDYETQSTGEYLFKRNGKFISSHTLGAHMKKVFQGSVLEKGPHQLRHLYATHLLLNNIDLKTIQKQLRHASVSTTEKYLHELSKDIRESVFTLEF